MAWLISVDLVVPVVFVEGFFAMSQCGDWWSLCVGYDCWVDHMLMGLHSL